MSASESQMYSTREGKKEEASSRCRVIFFCRLFLFVPFSDFVIPSFVACKQWLVRRGGRPSSTNRGMESQGYTVYRVANLGATWHHFNFWIRSRKDSITFSVRLRIYTYMYANFFYYMYIFRKEDKFVVPIYLDKDRN